MVFSNCMKVSNGLHLILRPRQLAARNLSQRKSHNTRFAFLFLTIALLITMLLNHSSGLPGTDARGLFALSPVPEYSSRVLETLKGQRLKHQPGYLNTYCNDVFTLVEQVVLAVTGRSYARFVQDEILGPLGMIHSSYPLDYFPSGAFARVYINELLEPQQFTNSLATGGLYSTPTDMAKIPAMLIGKGKYGSQRILSESSVAAMGVDQTWGVAFHIRCSSVFDIHNECSILETL
jgi:CubicO group peptidase (beta-lactamase class C family)